MSRISGRKQVLAIGADDSTPPEYPADDVLYLRNVDISGASPEVDVTAAGDDWQQYRSGAAPGATMTATFVTDVDGTGKFQVWDEWVAGDEYLMAWLPEGDGTGNLEVSFSGVILQHDTSSAYDGSVEGTIQIRINSAPTYAAISA